MVLRTSIALLVAVAFPCTVFRATVHATPSPVQAETSSAEEDPLEAGEESAEEHAEEEHGEEHAEHDSDPTHGDMSDQAWGVVDFRTDLALFTAVVFVLLITALYMTAWKPIMEGLEKRERRIADNIAHAEKASAEADVKLAEYESKLESAAQEATQIVAEARKDGEAAGQKLIASAQEEAASLKDRALADIEAAKRVALNDLASQSSDVAMSLAKRVVGREVRAEDHQSLIQEMLSKLPSNN